MTTHRKSLWWWLTLVGCLVSCLAASQVAPCQERQPAAELIALIGQAEIKSPGETQFRPANIKDALYPQDQIRTLKDSRAKLFFRDDSILVLSENTTLNIAEFQMDSQGRRQSALMKILQGSIRFIVQRIAAEAPSNFNIQGLTAVMGIRGTDGIYETRSPDVIYFLSGNNTLTILNTTTGQRIILTPNHFVLAEPGRPLRSRVIPPEMRRRLLGYFRLAQSFIPGTVASPPPPPPALLSLLRGRGISFGNPLINQDSEFRNLFNPAAQGSGNLQAPLSVTHQPLIPR